MGVAPEVFALDGDGRAVVVGTPDDDHLVREAAWSCPTDAITLLDEDGNEILP